MFQVLLIDDDESVQTLVKLKLKNLYNIVSAMNLAQARFILKNNPPDFIVLDEHLPDGDGRSFLKKIMIFFEIPVIMLTSNKDIKAKQEAFSAGAVDYLTKPFDPVELDLRINARMNKSVRQEKGDLLFDYKRQKLFVVKSSNNNADDNTSIIKESNILIDLTPAEFKILLLLCDSPGKIFNRDSIIAKIWGNDHDIDNRTIDQHISKIRKKLKYKSMLQLMSKHGQGYFVRLSALKAS